MKLLDALIQGLAGKKMESVPRISSPSSPSSPPSPPTAEAFSFLAMPLDQFQAEGALLEVRVPWLEVTLWLVPAERDVAVLLREGLSRGRIWTAAELMQLMALSDRRSDTVKTLALAKLTLDGTISDVQLHLRADGAL
jgi:hypothetical protein